MTTRRTYHPDDRALTAVVGTILLVVIAIFAAGSVFAVVLIISETQEPAEPVAVATDQSSDRVKITKALPNADWANIAVRVTEHGGSATSIHMGSGDPYHNEAAAATGADVLAGAQPVASTSTPIKSTDYLDFCADQPTTDVRLAIIDRTANTQIAAPTFLTLRAC